MSPADLIGIETVSGLEGVNFPENYARRALPVFQEAVADTAMVPWIRANSDGTYPKVRASVLADAAGMAAQFADSGVSWLGGFAATNDTVVGQSVTQIAHSSRGKAAKAVGVIDVGFAFWNDRFIVDGDCLFDDVGFMSLDGEDRIWLGGEAIKNLIHGTDPTFRNQNVRKALAETFPQSIYAAKERGLPIFAPSGFNHGTAMADIALGDQSIPTFALELPSDVLLDSSGDLLEAHLIPALRVMQSRMLAHPDVAADTEMVILLAFGYPGGLHDGTRPIVRAMRTEIDALNVKLVIPMGNHLQERCHARLDLTGDDLSAPLTWVFPVEDYSPNHVALYYDGVRPEMVLTDPLGTAVKWEQEEPRVAKIMGRAHSQTKDVVLGLAVDTPNAEGGGKVDIILAAVAGEGPICRAGRWSLQFSRGSKQLNAWISRDDMAIPGAVARRRKQSWFEDDNYQIYGSFGRKAQNDAPNAKIKRAGTASALSTFATGLDNIVVVGAGQTTFDGVINADYSGLPYDGSTPQFEVVHKEIGSSGILALGNGSVTKFRVSGSSVAAAMRVKSLLNA